MDPHALQPASKSAMPTFSGSPRTEHPKTKLVCTVGPATCDAENLRRLIEAGANVLRLNFSHADHPWHSRVLDDIRKIATEMDLPVAIMQDLCGPKIRLSYVADDALEVNEGDTLRITTDAHRAKNDADNTTDFDVSTTYPLLPDDVVIGDTILLDEGRIDLEVIEKQPGLVVTTVRRGGRIIVGKGLNLPGVSLSAEAMTRKDWEDLEWGIAHEIDLIALSFVRRPEDLIGVRERLDEAGSHAQLIAKIERPEAIDHLEQILPLADGLMVARGDLGLETDLAQVPLLQKRLIERCRQANKPVITATQMLESMILNSTPTRAEVSDVANAIYDGTDAIMLSAETATGRHPERAVRVLHHVAQVTEGDLATRPELQRRRGPATDGISAIIDGAAITAIGLDANSLVVYTQTGDTARLLASYRLPMPIIAVTNVKSTYRQLSLSFGVHPVFAPDVTTLPELLEKIDHLVLDKRLGAEGDTLVVVSALDGRDGHTDTLHVHRVHA